MWFLVKVRVRLGVRLVVVGLCQGKSPGNHFNVTLCELYVVSMDTCCRIDFKCTNVFVLVGEREAFFTQLKHDMKNR